MRDEREINFFDVVPKNRDYSNPVTPLESEILGRFGKEYFESPFTHGYHGYKYNGSYANGAERMIDHFGLQPAARVLDVGCAKGFLLHDFFKHDPSLNLYGIDVSQYALDNATDLLLKRGGVCASGAFLPFKNNQFDLVTCINVLINLSERDCRSTVREINRVGKSHKFISVPSYRNEIELQNLCNWVPVANCVLSVDEWKRLFDEEGYNGHYYWFIFHDV